jgi:hypothetical protein
MIDCKKCEINIGFQDIILKIDEKIIFHVIVGEKIIPDDVVDKIQLALLDYVKTLVNNS